MSSQNHNSGTYRVLWNPRMLSSHVYGHSGGKKEGTNKNRLEERQVKLLGDD